MKKAAFIPFMMAGFPDIQTSFEAILALAQSGADYIEIGVPFSDPIADGPVIQKASDIALKNGMNLNLCLNLVQQLRNTGCTTPFILFSYFNPILAMGIDIFAQQAKEAGVTGVLIVDLPPEEGEAIYVQLQQAGLQIILLASPTTDPKRYVLYQKLNPHFIYYISRCGVTGVQNTLPVQLENEVNHLRKYFPNIPIMVGFGISTPEQAGEVAKFADGVVVGSLFIQILGINT
jgi:tryptophan synthase alpha subunit